MKTTVAVKAVYTPDIWEAITVLNGDYVEQATTLQELQDKLEGTQYHITEIDDSELS